MDTILNTTEFWFLFTTFLTMGAILAAYKLGKVYLMSLVAICLVLSNVIGPKIVSVFGYAITAGTPLFAALPLATDLLTERYGKTVARNAVVAAFVGMILFALISRPVIHMAWLPFSESAGTAVDTLMSSSLRLMIASPLAYAIWQFIDIGIYHFIKARTGEPMLWLRNNVSTVVAQAGSTLTFFFLAFAGTDVPWLQIAIVTIGFYWVIAALDTVVVYAAKHVEPLEFDF